jgi:hypothetical protein
MISSPVFITPPQLFSKIQLDAFVNSAVDRTHKLLDTAAALGEPTKVKSKTAAWLITQRRSGRVQTWIGNDVISSSG